MTKKEKWIDYWCRAFKEEEAKTPRTVGAVVIDNTVAVMSIDTTIKPRIGVAKCSPDDDFNLDTGLAIAYCRMIGISVPDCVLNDTPKVSICDLAIGNHYRHEGRRYVKISHMRREYIPKCKGNRWVCDAYCLDTGKMVIMVKDTKDGFIEPINFDD